MRHATGTLALLMLVLAPGTRAEAQTPDTYRVLFLGNSTFYAVGGIYQPFEGFCAAAGLDCEAVWQGTNSPSVRHGIETLGLGRTPTRALDIARTEWIHSMIESGGFDYVVLDQSRPGWLMPDWVENVNEGMGRPQDPYEETLAAYVEVHRTIVESGAETVLFARNILANRINWTQPLTQVVVRLGADLGRVEINGARHPVPVVPLMSLVLDAVTEFGVEEWFEDDLAHPSRLTQYAAACMVFTYITGLDPRQSPFLDLGHLWQSPEGSPTTKVPEEIAMWIKNQVWLYYTTGR